MTRGRGTPRVGIVHADVPHATWSDALALFEGGSHVIVDIALFELEDKEDSERAKHPGSSFVRVRPVTVHTGVVDGRCRVMLQLQGRGTNAGSWTSIGNGPSGCSAKASHASGCGHPMPGKRWSSLRGGLSTWARGGSARMWTRRCLRRTGTGSMRSPVTTPGR